MIVVTGGAGFIGSVLVSQLNDLGQKDILIVDDKAEESPKWKNLEKRKFSEYFEAGGFVNRLEQGGFKDHIDTIFHLGACTDTTETNKAYLWEVNLDYSKRLAEWCHRKGVQFLYASSAATYGAGENGYSDEDKVTVKLKPLNLYGESKQLFDLWVLEKNLTNEFAGFKFFNVFGPNEYHKGDMRSMVQKGYEQIKETGKIRLFKSYKNEYADGEQLRDFIYVKDVLKVMMWFWKNPGKRGIYNLGVGKARSWNDLANALFLALDLEPKIEYFEMPMNLREQYQYHTEADLAKLRKAGFSNNFQTLEDSVKDYVLNYLEKEEPYL